MTSYCAGCLAEGAINCPRCKEGSRAVAHYGIPRIHDELHKITKICKKKKLRQKAGE
jgi:hypothetical protein